MLTNNEHRWKIPQPSLKTLKSKFSWKIQTKMPLFHISQPRFLDFDKVVLTNYQISCQEKKWGTPMTFHCTRLCVICSLRWCIGYPNSFPQSFPQLLLKCLKTGLFILHLREPLPHFTFPKYFSHKVSFVLALCKNLFFLYQRFHLHFPQLSRRKLNFFSTLAYHPCFERHSLEKAKKWSFWH